MIDLSTRSEYDDTGNSTPRVIPVIRMNRRMNQDFYVKFALFVPVLVSHIQSASSDGSSKLSRGSANYHLESALLSTCTSSYYCNVAMYPKLTSTSPALGNIARHIERDYNRTLL